MSSSTSSSTSSSITTIMTAMTEAVEMDASLRKRFNAQVLFRIEHHGDTLLDARKDTSKAAKSKPDLIVQTSPQVLQELLDKKLTPQQAFMKGKLKIKGKMGLAMKLKLVLDATRKHLNVTTARL